ncbi:MAG: putative porin [Melioribacteraceae bacterium]
MKKIFLFLFFIYLFISANVFAGKYFPNSSLSKNFFSDTLKTKQSSLKDTTVQKRKKEILLPIKNQSLLDNHLDNFVLSKEKLRTTDYRTAADFFTIVPFGFVRDLGSVGQPSETLIYGNGFGNISFMSDGILINNRLTNSLDLNLFQSESIDSIEVIPLARGFLYGNSNNPVSINFISRESDSRKSFSRLKYYQAANGEGLMDGIFNIYPLHKLNAYIEITNQNTNPNYANTDYSNWSGTTRLSYLFSKSVNLIASYRYLKSKVQLNGGVDSDSILISFPAAQFYDVVYNNLQAPVNYTDRYQKVTVNDFRLRMLANFIDSSYTDLALYYQSNLIEFRQNEYLEISQNILKQIFDNNFQRTIGLNLRQDLDFKFGKLISATNLERSVFNTPFLAKETRKSSFSESLLASFDMFGDSFTPSVFGKYLNYSDKSYIGIGADADISLGKSFNLYAGFSSYQKPYNAWEERFVRPFLTLDTQKKSSLEFTLLFRNRFANVSIGYFNQSTGNALLSTTFIADSSYEQTSFFAIKNLLLNGLNLKLDFRVWKILLSTNTNIYFPSENRKEYKLPGFTSSGGIYYVDTLFKSNLELKTGLNYYSIGTRDFIHTDYEKNITSYFDFNPITATQVNTSPSVSPSFQLDFFLAGRIQKSATIYFVWENLLDAKYFIVPYYPKQERSIRFGVAWEFLD